jgi:LPXTG-site transpeptidase (sortase) family protein
MGKLLICLGIIILLFSGFFFYERYNPQSLSFSVNDLNTITAKSTYKPTEITIPSIDLRLPIIPAKLEKGKWESTTKGISYLSSSPIPGNQGNSILYGHDWPNLLGNITKLKPGQKITIKYSNNKTRDFIIYSTILVSPKETSILAPSKDARITLYTCAGFWDNKRFVVVAKVI